MAFLRSGLIGDVQLQIQGRGVHLRPPAPADYAAWAELRNRSRDHLIPWEPQWSRDELSRSAFRRRLRHYHREMKEDLGYALFIFRDGDGELLGGLTLSNVRRGVTQAVSLGYWTGAPYVRRGVMTEAVAATAKFVFDELQLHRVEAACLPHNHASIRVLEQNGFQYEGLARRYLKIDGTWRDHLLYALLTDDPRGIPAGGRT
jgi:[ribosomal protein S5]-alanine N-acetyltransferase